MVENKYFKLIFYIVLFIAFITSFSITIRRFQFEASDNSVEIVMSLNEIKELSVRGGDSVDNILQRLKKDGHVTTISLEEDTLKDMVNEGLITVLQGSEIINMYRIGHINRYLLTNLYSQQKPKPDHFYIIVQKRADFDHIRSFLNVEFGSDKVKRIGRELILQVLDEKEDLMNLGLGISSRNLSMIKSMGFKTVVRLKNSNRLSEEVVKQKLLSFTDVSSESLVIFDGDSVLGYPTQLELMTNKLRDKQINIGVIEFFDQLGMDYISKNLYYNIKRVHSVPVDEMVNYSQKSLLKRYLRAAKERGIDLFFIHPIYKKYESASLIDYNIKFLDKLYNNLIQQGLNINSLAQYPIKDYQPAKQWELMLISLAVFSIIVLFVSYFTDFSIGQLFLTYFVFIAVMYFSYFFNYGHVWNSVMAFISAALFPCLAIISQFPQKVVNDDWFNRFLSMFVYLIKVICVCMIGAFFVVSFLSDLKYILNVNSFWGVKFSFILPLIIIGLFFYLSPNRITSLMFVFRRLYYAPVRTAGLLSMLFIVFFVIVLILRSGNSFFLPSFGFETSFRTMLENLFFVRPRTKEFIIGYPFLLLTFLFVDKKLNRTWIWFFNVIGAVALISLINSFCHTHTPLEISLYRTCLGVVLGVLFTSFYLGVYLALERLFKRLT